MTDALTRTIVEDFRAASISIRNAPPDAIVSAPLKT